VAKFKADRLRAGISTGTINKDLASVRRILNLAARVWRHENGMTYLLLRTVLFTRLALDVANNPF